PAVQDALWSLPINRTNDALGFLPMFEGMWVMLTENLAISKSLVNGAIGMVTGIQYKFDCNGCHYPTAVMVNMPGCDHAQAHLPPNTICVQPCARAYSFESKCSDGGKNVSHSISRKFQPLLPAYAYTDYKSQG
ncbi:hypothetical protein DACRYDRAFT_57673, partial [Dacryopinax primogenitus]